MFFSGGLFCNIALYLFFINHYTQFPVVHHMKTLASALMVSIFLVSLSSGIHGTCSPDETIIPYIFPEGIINIIQRSENMFTPFYNLVEENYPLIQQHYIVENEGYLEITLNPVNGSRPEMLLNEEPVYTSDYCFYNGKVASGDVFMVELYPPEHLNSTFTITVDNRIITIYEVYNWDEMNGEIIFKEIPRSEIDPGFSCKPVKPVEDDELLFKPDINAPLSSTQWTLTGEGVFLKSHNKYFTTPPLAAGGYNVVLLVEDEFGYNRSESMSIEVGYDIDPVLYDPSLTVLEVAGVNSPSTVGPDSFMNLTVSLMYSAPIPRDIRVSIIDQFTEEELSRVSDHINGEGATSYDMAFVSQNFPLELLVETAFLHEGQWVPSGVSDSFTINAFTPSNKAEVVPGYPWVGGVIGVFIYLLKRKSKVTLPD